MNIRVVVIVAAILLGSARLLLATPQSIDERLDSIRKAAATLEHPITRDAAINTLGLGDDYQNNPPVIFSFLNHECFEISIQNETRISFVVYPNGNVRTIEIFTSQGTNQIYSQQSGPAYPPQGVGSADP